MTKMTYRRHHNHARTCIRMSTCPHDGALFGSHDYEISFARCAGDSPLSRVSAHIGSLVMMTSDNTNKYVTAYEYIELDDIPTARTRGYPRADRVPATFTIRPRRKSTMLRVTRPYDFVYTPHTSKNVTEIPFIDECEHDLVSPSRACVLVAHTDNRLVLAFSLTMSAHERRCVMSSGIRNRAVVWLLTRTGHIYALDLTQLIPPQSSHVRWFGGEPMSSSSVSFAVSLHKTRMRRRRRGGTYVRVWMLTKTHRPIIWTMRVAGPVHCVYICNYGVAIAFGSHHRTIRVVAHEMDCLHDELWCRYDARWRRGWLPQTCGDPEAVDHI